MTARVPKHAVPLVLAAALASACTDSHRLDPDASVLPDARTEVDDGGRFFRGPTSWNVIATLRSGSGTFGDGSTEIVHAFTLAVEHPGPRRALAGAFGAQSEVTITYDADHTATIDEPLEIAIPTTGTGCGGHGPAIYDQLTLVFEDTDGEIGSDRIDGTGTGSVRFMGGDVIWDTPFTATLVATLDETPPSLEIAGGTLDRNPVDGAFVRISEPVSSSLQVALVAPDGSEIPLERPAGRAASFATPPDRVLAFGTTYRVEPRPLLTDLAGNPIPPIAFALSTTADPGVQPEDGFEGGARALLRGGAGLVDASEGALVLSGSRSVVLPPSEPWGSGGGRVTMRLAVEPSATVLRLTYALLARGESGGYLFGYARLLSDGSAAVPLTFTSTASAWQETGIASAPLRGPVEELVVTLPASARASGEVVLDVTVNASPCGGPLPDLLGLMIDDIVVE